MNAYIAMFIATVFALSTGCSTLVTETASSKQDAKAKEFRSIPGKSVVYIYHDESAAKGFFTSTLLINGESVTKGANGRFNVVVLKPGSYEFGVTSDYQKGHYLPMKVTFKENSIHYIHVYWLSQDDYLGTGYFLSAVSEAEARSVIAQEMLISWKELCSGESQFGLSGQRSKKSWLVFKKECNFETGTDQVQNLNAP